MFQVKIRKVLGMRILEGVVYGSDHSFPSILTKTTSTRKLAKKERMVFLPPYPNNNSFPENKGKNNPKRKGKSSSFSFCHHNFSGGKTRWLFSFRECKYHPKTNSKFAPENRSSQKVPKGNFIFQPSIIQGRKAVSLKGEVYISGVALSQDASDHKDDMTSI